MLYELELERRRIRGAQDTPFFDAEVEAELNRMEKYLKDKQYAASSPPRQSLSSPMHYPLRSPQEVLPRRSHQTPVRSQFDFDVDDAFAPEPPTAVRRDPMMESWVSLHGDPNTMSKHIEMAMVRTQAVMKVPDPATHKTQTCVTTETSVITDPPKMPPVQWKPEEAPSIIYPPHLLSTNTYLNGAAPFFDDAEVRVGDPETEDVVMRHTRQLDTDLNTPTFVFPHRHSIVTKAHNVGKSPGTKSNAAADKWKDISFNDAEAKRAFANLNAALEVSKQVKTFSSQLKAKSDTFPPEHVGNEALKYAPPKLGARWDVFNAMVDLDVKTDVGDVRQPSMVTPAMNARPYHYTVAPFFNSALTSTNPGAAPAS